MEVAVHTCIVQVYFTIVIIHGCVRVWQGLLCYEICFDTYHICLMHIHTYIRTYHTHLPYLPTVYIYRMIILYCLLCMFTVCFRHATYMPTIYPRRICLP